MPPLSPVIQALLLINTGLFFAAELVNLGPLALWPLGSGFLPWQVITYAFLHGSFIHLFFNMFGLWMFGSELEQLWGPRRFLQFYFASLLTAAAAQLIFAAVTGLASPTVGASGAVFGLLLGYGLKFPTRQVLMFPLPMPIRAKTLAIGYGVLELTFGLTGTLSGIAHFAHLGGMLGAWLMMRYWSGQPPFGRSRPRR
jgi:membrane associated rhomboid family serine protease